MNKRGIYKNRGFVCGVGINDADYVTQINELVSVIDGKKKMRKVWRCPYYSVWCSMLNRAYGKKNIERRPTYEGCSVCEEWLTFTNFKKWMEQQNWEGKHLDKDLLVEGNKLYSPDTCVFVDAEVNAFLTDSFSARGEFPTGVSYHKRRNKFQAYCNQLNKTKVHLGYFDNPEDAHIAWANEKFRQAKILALRQEDEKVSEALIKRYFDILERSKQVYYE